MPADHAAGQETLAERRAILASLVARNDYGLESAKPDLQSTFNDYGLESAKPDLQSTFKKPGGDTAAD